MYNHASQGADQDQRKFGVDLIGEIPWGTHLCQFYDSKQDLIDILVPYFAEGLRSNEFCMWITSQPLDVEEAKEALKKAVPDLDEYLQRGQIEIVSYADWYLLDGKFDSSRVLQGWVQKESAALERGFEGLRLTGNTLWVERDLWKSFVDYEEAINSVIGKHRMTAVCTYCLARCSGTDVLDVVRNHVGTLVKQGEKWYLVEDAARRKEVNGKLKLSEQKYGALFSNMQDGFAYHKVLFDESGKPVDYVFLEINESFERLVGLKRAEIIGQKVTRVLPGIEKDPADLIGVYGKVALTGESVKFENYDQALGKWFLVSAFCPEKGYFAATFEDVTERKKAEEEAGRLASFPQLNPNSVVDTDIDGNMYYSNPATDLMLPGLKTSGLSHPFFSDWKDVVKQLQNGKRNFGRHIRVGDHWFYQQFCLVPGISRVRVYTVNIDSLKQTENELRETRDYLDSLLNYANAPVIVWDSGFRITMFNHAFERLTGHSAQDVVGKPLGLLFPPDQKEQALSHIRRTIEGEYWEAVEIPILRSDGTVRTVLWNSANIHDAMGKNVIATIAQGQDITERKKAEQQVLEQLQMLDLTHLLVMNMKDEITFWDAGAEKMYGFSKHEALGKTPHSLLKTRFPEPLEEIKKELEINGKWEGELVHTKADGGQIFVASYWVLHRDDKGNPLAIIEVNNDITPTKAAENELQETRNYLNNLLDYANAPIIVWNPEFKITRFNRAFERLTGLRAEDAIGKPLDILFPKDRKDEAMSHIQSTLAGEYWESVEIPILHKDGTTRIVLWNSANICAPSKNIVATIAQGQDITERLKLERQLRWSEHVSGIGEAAAMVGHDLRNPLQAIVGFVDLAEELLDRMSCTYQEREENKKLLRSIDDQVFYMNKIVSDLQDYAGPIRPARLRTDLHQLIDGTLSTIVVPENVSYSVNIPKSFPKMRIDPTILRRVLTNLITNALQAMPNGGKFSVKVSRKKSPQTLVLNVEDTGIGISRQNRSRLFTPLFTTKSKGQGFGLPVCKRLIEACGGTITFESRVGKGTKFTIKIPLKND